LDEQACLRFQGGTKKAAYLVIFEGGSKLPHSKPPCGRKKYVALGVPPALAGKNRGSTPEMG
jgi:hypothetical protein